MLAKNKLLIAPKGLTKAQKRKSKNTRRKLKQRIKRFRRWDTDHRRFAAYKPGHALIVADRARSKRQQVFRRYFQFGPDIVVSEEGSRLRLRGPDFVAHAENSGSAGSGELTIDRGCRPYSGCYFPDAKREVPRYRAVWKTRGRAVDHLTVIGLGNRIEGGRIAGSIGGGGVVVELTDGRGNVVETVRIDRNRRDLTIDAD